MRLKVKKYNEKGTAHSVNSRGPVLRVSDAAVFFGHQFMVHCATVPKLKCPVIS